MPCDAEYPLATGPERAYDGPTRTDGGGPVVTAWAAFRPDGQMVPRSIKAAEAEVWEDFYGTAEPSEFWIGMGYRVSQVDVRDGDPRSEPTPEESPPTWQRHRLRIDIGGVAASALDILKGVENPLRRAQSEDDREGVAAMLEQFQEHLTQLKAEKVLLADFLDFYCITPARGLEG